MNKKIKIFASVIVFLTVPFSVCGQQTDLIISANKIIVEPDEVLHAQGNVLVQHGDKKFKAQMLKFDQASNEIILTDLEEFHDGRAIKISSKEALISSDLSEGIIRSASILIDDAIKIRTGEVSLSDGKISNAKGISRVTSCKECEGKDPKWFLTASSAKRDNENSNIIYKNVTVRVKGFPVAYIPYLRMPDPSVDRARGFLVPEAALTSNLATGLKLPYFIPMGLSSDILLTPYFRQRQRP